MSPMLIRLYLKLQDLKKGEEGQDLVEYALVVALIAFGATSAMHSLSTAINVAYQDLSRDLIG